MRTRVICVERMPMYSRFAKNFFGYVISARSIGHLAILERTQWLKREEIAKIQQQRLRALMKHAYFKVPYYHRVFKKRGLKPSDIKNRDDLARLPVLTKEEIRKNFNDLTARDFPKKMILDSTGGSTGKPLRFYKTRESKSWTFAAALRAYGWARFELGDKQALIWGSPVDLSGFYRLRGRILNFLLRTMILDSSSMSEVSMKKFAKKLVRFRPKVVRGYASGVFVFAKFLEKEGIDVKPDAVITSAETLFSHQRTKIEDVFGCAVHDFYGSREAPALASECSEKCGYHISSENVLLEFARDGEQVATNETGIVLVTNLHNYAMPFIRYEIGDLGKPLGKACPCGRGLPLMGSLEGRLTDVIAAPNGNFVSAPVLTLIFKDLHVKEYQIVQESLEKIKVKIVKDDKYSQEDSNYIIRGMQKYIGGIVQIDIEFVDSIPPDKSGKRRVVISKVPLGFK